MAICSANSTGRLLWIDMEMTGLEVEKEVILEVGAVVTDFNFQIFETYHACLKQPQSFIDNMDDWNSKHHRESGLVELCEREGQPPLKVEDELIQLGARHFLNERVILAGNTIGQDRAFINRHMPRFAAKLHYRMMDVTAWKIIMNGRFNIKYTKKGAHRAVDDIYESMNELKLYLSHFRDDFA